jgi:nucleoside ABC transporter ATP-binding protein
MIARFKVNLFLPKILESHPPYTLEWNCNWRVQSLGGRGSQGMEGVLSSQGSKLAVSMKGITKVYPDGVIALRDVDFNVLEGEIHALLGENGAGKTTLMRILYGEIKPTKGEIFVWDRRVSFRNPRDALATGIAMVYQTFTLIPNFTVLDNIYIASSSIMKASRRGVKERLYKLMEELDFKIHPDSIVEELPIGVQQKVEILKALIVGARILILDEPTSVLTPYEAKALFELLRVLKSKGVTVILITHRLGEVTGLADRVTVLRRGRVVGVFNTRDVDERTLAKLMVGGEVEPIRATPTIRGGIALSVEDLFVRDDRGVMRVKGVSFKVHYGEIVGIAGVQGNGQKELLEAIAGLRVVERGKIIVDGFDATYANVTLRRKLGLAYIPDSRGEGLALNMSIAENSVITLLERFLGGLRRIRWDSVERHAENVANSFNIVYRSLRDPVVYLSGGNQQRLMVGREISIKPRILIAHEPTHGLDVASSNFVRSKLLELKREGSAILLASSDLDEILSVSDRILVLFDGRVVGEGAPWDFNEERLGLLMGGYVEVK